MEGMVDWLAGLPPAAIYLVIALMAAIENVFPPFPADTAIALGAFLSSRGITNGWLVLAVTLVANVASAMGIYWLAARHSRLIFDSSLAKRFLPEEGLAFVRKEYERFGLLGLFIGRFLPGFRAVVAPFAGLIHLGAWRAFVPISLASAVWYGGIILVAAQLGEHWDLALQWISNFNRLAGIAILAVAMLLAAWWWRRRRSARAE